MFIQCFGVNHNKLFILNIHFQPPVAPDKWEGVRDATKEASESLAKHLVFLHPVGSEDCLYLNVFTPKVSVSALNL